GPSVSPEAMSKQSSSSHFLIIPSKFRVKKLYGKKRKRASIKNTRQIVEDLSGKEPLLDEMRLEQDGCFSDLGGHVVIEQLFIRDPVPGRMLLAQFDGAAHHARDAEQHHVGKSCV